MSKTILITGASSGFGRDTAESLARAGHTVFASMREPQAKNRTQAQQLRNQGIAVVELDVSPTSVFYETNSFNFNGIGLLLVTIGRVPCGLRFDHGIGDPEHAVELDDVRVRGGGFSDSQGRTVAGGQDDGADLMRLESVAHGCP